MVQLWECMVPQIVLRIRVIMDGSRADSSFWMGPGADSSFWMGPGADSSF